MTFCSTVNFAYSTKALFDAIGGMTEAPLQNSDVRIYCDNDEYGPGKRWQLVPDVAGAETPNSKQPFKKQQYLDHINQVTRHTGYMGCQKSPDILGVTYSMTLTPDTGTDQNPKRAVISVSIVI